MCKNLKDESKKKHEIYGLPVGNERVVSGQM